jgi:hypothetical protein
MVNDEVRWASFMILRIQGDTRSQRIPSSKPWFLIPSKPLDCWDVVYRPNRMIRRCVAGSFCDTVHIVQDDLEKFGRAALAAP